VTHSAAICAVARDGDGMSRPVQKNLGKFSDAECIQTRGNDFELIPTVKMETGHPVEGSFGNEFPTIYNHCGVMAA